MEYTYIRNVPLFIQSLNLNIFHFYLLDLVTLAIHPLWIHLPICLWEGSEQWKEKPSFMERWEYWGTYPTKCWHVHTWKDFNLKWNQRIWNGYSHRHPQKKLKAYILISIKCLIYRRPKTYLPTNKICLSPHPQANEFTAWILAGCLPLCTSCP